MKILRVLFRPFASLARYFVATEIWIEFASNPWRIAVWTVWTFVMPAWWYFANPELAKIIFVFPDFGLASLAYMIAWNAFSGFIVATIDLSGDREHRLLAMANLPIVAMCVMVPVGLSIGLVSIMQGAVGVGAQPVGALVRGGDLYGNEAASFDPLAGLFRGKVYDDMMIASLALGDRSGETLDEGVTRAAWDLAQGRSREASVRCARLRDLAPRAVRGGAFENRLSEVEVFVCLSRGGTAKEAVSIQAASLSPDVRRGLLRAWLHLQTGDTGLARANLPATEADPGASPWVTAPHLDAMPRIWAADLSEALPEEAERIKGSLARIEAEK